ncbi:MAG: hypothetical protein ACREMQ_05750, partial [Longimicrobiales bacterium]
QMGVSDAFFAPNNPLRSGVYLGVSAEPGKVDVQKVWLKGGRLVTGNDPIAATPYQAYDYMVLAVERRDRRDDWPSLPGIASFQEEFAGIMASADPVAEKRKKLGPVWVRFTEALAASTHLTVPDREAVAGDVQQDLQKRLDAMERGNPFETKSWGAAKAKAISPTAYDFVDVERSVNVRDAQSRRFGREALASKSL